MEKEKKSIKTNEDFFSQALKQIVNCATELTKTTMYDENIMNLKLNAKQKFALQMLNSNFEDKTLPAEVGLFATELIKTVEYYFKKSNFLDLIAQIKTNGIYVHNNSYIKNGLLVANPIVHVDVNVRCSDNGELYFVLGSNYKSNKFPTRCFYLKDLDTLWYVTNPMAAKYEHTVNSSKKFLNSMYGINYIGEGDDCEKKQQH